MFLKDKTVFGGPESPSAKPVASPVRRAWMLEVAESGGRKRTLTRDGRDVSIELSPDQAIELGRSLIIGDAARGEVT